MLKMNGTAACAAVEMSAVIPESANYYNPKHDAQWVAFQDPTAGVFGLDGECGYCIGWDVPGDWGFSFAFDRSDGVWKAEAVSPMAAVIRLPELDVHAWEGREPGEVVSGDLFKHAGLFSRLAEVFASAEEAA